MYLKRVFVGTGDDPARVLDDLGTSDVTQLDRASPELLLLAEKHVEFRFYLHLLFLHHILFCLVLQTSQKPSTVPVLRFRLVTLKK